MTNPIINQNLALLLLEIDEDIVKEGLNESETF
jgi:hypothetical protein